MSGEDEFLVCPVADCDHEVWVSPEDPDASLTHMHRHFVRYHPDSAPLKLLAQAAATTREEPTE